MTKHCQSSDNHENNEAHTRTHRCVVPRAHRVVEVQHTLTHNIGTVNVARGRNNQHRSQCSKAGRHLREVKLSLLETGTPIHRVVLLPVIAQRRSDKRRGGRSANQQRGENLERYVISRRATYRARAARGRGGRKIGALASYRFASRLNTAATGHEARVTGGERGRVASCPLACRASERARGAFSHCSPNADAPFDRPDDESLPTFFSRKLHTFKCATAEVGFLQKENVLYS